MASIVIPISTGNVAAILTALEFIIASAVVYCIDSFLSSVWILRLKKKKKLTINEKTSKYHNTRKEILSFIIGIIFVISVAFVESGLVEKRTITNKIQYSDLCATMSEDYNPNLLKKTKPPVSFKLDTISQEIASNLDCPFGIDTLEFGAESFIQSGTIPFYVPNCAASPAPVLSHSNMSKFFVNEIVFDEHLMFSEFFQSPFYIIPNNISANFREARLELEVGQLQKAEPCEARNLSSIAYVAEEWKSTEVDDLHIARLILERICNQHDESAVPISDSDLPNDCRGGSQIINITCLRTFATTNEGMAQSVELQDVSLLMVLGDEAENFNAKGYACTDSTVMYEYVLVPESVVLSGSSNKKYMIVPTSISIKSGRCEFSPHAVGIGAVIYAARTTWYSDLNEILSDLTHHQRYYAYLMAIARSYYPYFDLYSSHAVNRTACQFRIAGSGTVIQIQWIFIVMICAFILSVVAIIVAVLLSIFLPKQSFRFYSDVRHLTALLSKHNCYGSIFVTDFYGANSMKLVSEERVPDGQEKFNDGNSPAVTIEEADSQTNRKEKIYKVHIG